MLLDELYDPSEEGVGLSRRGGVIIDCNLVEIEAVTHSKAHQNLNLLIRLLHSLVCQESDPYPQGTEASVEASAPPKVALQAPSDTSSGVPSSIPPAKPML
ncbi:hypothetical protein G4B88_021275 [Cannabis sativa]|uniref:Uncharacterized protein n=1 Tax=Cannabis sativa TaxID=3483 RepID=A0A7J6HZ34_CANSA|nr:hypothetical protein G4B88_021275 [Cannabis sativa]